MPLALLGASGLSTLWSVVAASQQLIFDAAWLLIEAMRWCGSTAAARRPATSTPPHSAMIAGCCAVAVAAVTVAAVAVASLAREESQVPPRAIREALHDGVAVVAEHRQEILVVGVDGALDEDGEAVAPMLVAVDTVVLATPAGDDMLSYSASFV